MNIYQYIINIILIYYVTINNNIVLAMGMYNATITMLHHIT